MIEENEELSGNNENHINAPSQKETPKVDYTISFHGSKKEFLGLSLYNLLLTVLTLGMYYPWAKCAVRKFLFQETEIDGSRFEWHGTGKEMFKGFIKAYVIIGSLFLIIQFGPMFIPPHLVVWFILGAYVLLIGIIPLAIHGMMRYRLSRTSLRGIHFGYRGELKGFYKQMATDFFFTIITLGIYGAWLQINARQYVMESSRYGNVKAKFDATGGDFFWLMFTQGFLIAITFYIYTPWAMMNIYKFYIENTKVVQNGKTYHLNSNASGGQFFLILIKGALVTVFTLGICGPIAQLWIHKYMIESISLSKGFDFNSVEQTEQSYKDATGDDMADILGLDF